MGVYKRITSTCGDPTDMYASVKEDGSKAVVHTSLGTKTYKRTTQESMSNDLFMKIRNSGTVNLDDLIPYIDSLGNYIFLTNKPKINGVTLEGDKSTEDLKIYANITADKVIFKDGSTVQEKFDKGEFGVKNYNELSERPSINGITLMGNLSSAELGIVDDSNVSLNATWSSSYIKSQIAEAPVVTVKEGTEQDPIIAEELPLGIHIISGRVQSSRKNITALIVPKKQYIINRDVEGTTVLWEQNPFISSQYYIIFHHSGLTAPEEKNIEVLTAENLKQAQLDCGEF